MVGFMFFLMIMVEKGLEKVGEKVTSSNIIVWEKSQVQVSTFLLSLIVWL